jgi:hypothetical protein
LKISKTLSKPFIGKNIQNLLYDHAWHRKTLEEVADILNNMAEEHYKDKIMEKGVIVPHEKASSKVKLLTLNVGESIYTECEQYKNRTKSHAFRLSKTHGMKFSTLKKGDGWMTWRIK